MCTRAGIASQFSVSFSCAAARSAWIFATFDTMESLIVALSELIHPQKQETRRKAGFLLQPLGLWGFDQRFGM